MHILEGRAQSSAWVPVVIFRFPLCSVKGHQHFMKETDDKGFQGYRRFQSHSWLKFCYKLLVQSAGHLKKFPQIIIRAHTVKGAKLT